MYAAGPLEMSQYGNGSVQNLQHQVIDALQTAAGRRIDRVACKLVEFGLNPANDAIEPAIDDRMCGARQHRRHKFVVEQNVLVAYFEDAGDAETHVSRLAGLAQLERQP